ncbi:MAG: SDR family NAD(P)-dependent oxidoreductase, partial [Nitrospinota bacterium]
MALADFNLDGRVALITGGGSGLGKAMASALAEAGADVIIASRNMERLERAAEELKASGRRVLPLQVDITDAASVRAMAERALGQMGRVDILVNNSGIGGEKRFTEMDEAHWDMVLHTNLRGAFLVSRALAEDMMGRGWGRIINVASVLASVGMPTLTAYCSSKGGLILFTKALALELVRYGITVNAICPGYFLTDLNRE